MGRVEMFEKRHTSTILALVDPPQPPAVVTAALGVLVELALCTFVLGCGF